MEDKKIVTNWLSKLQQESWNLELLISGFSIFLLIQGGDLLLDSIRSVQEDFQSNGGPVATALIFFMGTLYLASKMLIINLIVHVFLRGFWIGAIGLRSVQENIDFDRLNYTPFFTKKLKEKVGSLDQLLTQLDTLSSVIFAFTFLIIFMFFSLFLFVFFLIVLFQIILSLAGPYRQESFVQVTLAIFLLGFMSTGFLYMFDTLSLGLLKKIKWIKRFYYPIYRFYSFITLAGIYRSIYYSLVSRFPKKWIIAILVPYVFVFALGPFHKVDYYQFFPDSISEANLINNHYDDQRDEEKYVEFASIPSMIYDGDMLPLFIRYKIASNEALQASCTDYTPSKTTGLISGIEIGRSGFRINNPSITEEDPRALLKCLSEYYTIYLNDSLYTEADFYYRNFPNKDEFGIQTIINVKDLPRGKNHIKIDRKNLDEGELGTALYTSFPFWLE